MEFRGCSEVYAYDPVSEVKGQSLSKQNGRENENTQKKTKQNKTERHLWELTQTQSGQDYRPYIPLDLREREREGGRDRERERERETLVV